MTFGRETALRAGGGVFAIGLAWTSVGFFSFGLFEWLALYWGAIGAAFATASVCAAMTGAVAALALRTTGTIPVIQNVPQPEAIGQRANLVSALRELSAEHPLLAVCAAAVLGAVGESKR